VVVDPRRDTGGGEYADRLGELTLVIGGVGPYQRRVRPGHAGHLQSHQRDLSNERQVPRDECRQASEHRNGVPLDYDPDLHRLAERGQVEDAVHRLLERADGLDDEVVQARLGRVHRDADHDVGQRRVLRC
jgi:hypothetical protein